MICTLERGVSGSSARSPKLRSFFIPGPAGKLEVLLNDGAPDAPFAALVCHPHPLAGGNLHNKVVYQAMKVMNSPSFGFRWPVLRFHFRGAGRSSGEHDGHAEYEDVLAAMAWLENEFSRPLIVAGFSFGAAMALKACCLQPSRVHALAALGLPTFADGRRYGYSFLSQCNLPKLFLSGSRDPYAPAEELQQVAATTAEPKKLVLLPGADHFFAGQLPAMQNALASWLQEQCT